MVFVSPGMPLGGAVHVEIPVTMHRPLRQRMAELRGQGLPTHTAVERVALDVSLSLIHISEPTRPY